MTAGQRLPQEPDHQFLWAEVTDDQGSRLPSRGTTSELIRTTRRRDRRRLAGQATKTDKRLT